MNYQLIKYYKDTYTDDFNKYFNQECSSDDIIMSTLVPKTMGYPAKNPTESIFFRFYHLVYFTYTTSDWKILWKESDVIFS